MGEVKIFDKKKQGYVFNIQNYSVHDGPGIRTIVFLKGCPLRCKWCSNPESQSRQPELAYNSNKCIGINECMWCVEVCANGAITIEASADDINRIKVDRNLCNNCLKCADVCPAKALDVFGVLRSVNEVMDIVEKDNIFYSRSGGGITLSGGEPLMQADFAAALLKEAKRRRINTNIETCGHADWESMEKVCNYLDNIYMDIKCIDPVKHQEFTGVSNEKVLANFKKLTNCFPNIAVTVRTPVIPGFNDSEEDILAIINFIKGIPNVKYELLKYHRLGEAKYGYIGREYLMETKSVTDQQMATFNELVKRYFK
ncbi:glycyl-radical enzyme activating protein [Peptococcaceae bacterium 1198_IL3148]